MALTDTQKADVRRHLGFGPAGKDVAGNSFIGYRFFLVEGQLEYRLNNMRPEEELILVGTGNQPPSLPSNPNFQDPSTDIVYDGYLRICNFLEGAIATVTDNLDIEKAGDYTAAKLEMPNRIKLYRYWCLRMASFLEVASRLSNSTIMVS